MNVPMRQCPLCRLLIMVWADGPNGLAPHQCEEQTSGVMALVALAAAKPELTPDEAAVAGARVMLQQSVDGEKFDARGYGELLAGMAKFKDSGSESDDSTMRWLMYEEGEE